MPAPRPEPALQLPRLPAAPSPEALELHLAALEHALASPITIRDRDDVRSARHWSHLLEPFEHQVRHLITFGRRAPVVLIADDVGLGKTISAGLILSELATRGRVRRALVVAPRILLPQWREELASKFATRAEIGTGRAVRALAEGGAPVVLTTYATARDHMDALRAGGFDLAILDEAHRLRHLHGTPNPPRLATAMRAALADRAFTYVVMLTATPIQNRLWDLYSLVDLLCAAKGIENTLGTPAEFARAYLDDAPSVARRLKPGRRDDFRRHLSELMVRTDRARSGLVFPERRVSLQACPPGPVEDALRALLRRVLPGAGALARLSLAEAATSSPAALAAQLEVMAASGSAAEEAAAEARALAARSPTGAKMDVLRAFVADLRARAGGPVRAVVFARRVETVAAVAAALRADGVRVGVVRGGQPTANADAIAGYAADPPEVEVLVCTDAGAEGINLQAGNVVVNYDLPWNPMVVEQRIGRVQRLASKHRHVAVVNLVVAGSVEERVVGRLIERLQAVADTLGDVEAILEATGAGDDADEDFEADLRDLVVRALMGQDVAAATAALEATIERAKALYAEEREAVEEHLGRLDAMHEAGPRLPEFAPVRPRLDAAAFARRALAADGALVTEEADGGLRVAPAGAPSWTATVDPDDPRLDGPDPPVLLAEGRPAFERLLAAWGSRRGHVVRDARGRPTPEDVARGWWAAAGADGALAGVEVVDGAARLHGRVLLRATASVDHDRLERLVAVPVGDPVRAADATDAPPARTELFLPELTPRGAALDDALGAAVAAEPDLTAFAAFYEARGAEERARATSEAARADVGRRFAPRFAAELHALEGVLVQASRVALRFSVDGAGPYATHLDVDGARVARAPAVAVCAVSGARVPEDVLEPCARSGARALPHRLVRSARSGRAALPEHARACAVTGRTLLDDEVATSALTGVVADAELFATCAITGTTALQRELGRSDVSGAWARADLLVGCEASGARVLPSEAGVCARTGTLARADLLAASDLSGARVLATLLVRCPETGVRALPDELARCAETGALVAPTALVACSATGRRVRRSLTVACPACAAPLLRTEAVADHAGALGHREHLGRCAWSGAARFVHELGACRATGATLARELLDPGGLGRVHAELLADAAGGAPPDAAVLPLVADALRPHGRTIARAWVRPSPDGRLVAVVAEERAWLGLVRRRTLAYVDVARRRTEGDVAVGWRG